MQTSKFQDRQENPQTLEQVHKELLTAWVNTPTQSHSRTMQTLTDAVLVEGELRITHQMAMETIQENGEFTSQTRTLKRVWHRHAGVLTLAEPEIEPAPKIEIDLPMLEHAGLLKPKENWAEATGAGRRRPDVVRSAFETGGDDARAVAAQLFGLQQAQKGLARVVMGARDWHLELALALWEPGMPQDWAKTFLESLQNWRYQRLTEHTRAEGLIQLCHGLGEDGAGMKLRRKLLLKNLVTTRQADALFELTRTSAGHTALTEPQTWLTADQLDGWATLERAVRMRIRAHRHQGDPQVGQPRQTWAESPAGRRWEQLVQDDPELLNDRSPMFKTFTRKNQDILHRMKRIRADRIRRSLHRVRHQMDDGGPDLSTFVACTQSQLTGFSDKLGHCIASYGSRLETDTTLLVGVYEVPENLAEQFATLDDQDDLTDWSSMLVSTMEISNTLGQPRPMLVQNRGQRNTRPKQVVRADALMKKLV